MRVHARRWAVLGTAGAVALAACGGEDETAPSADQTVTDAGDQTTAADSPTPSETGTPRLATPRPTPSVVPAPTSDDRPTTVSPDVPDDWLAAAEDAAAAVAAETTGATDVPTPVVTGAVAVVWPDGSLGCPEPGVVYTQATVDGARVIVDVGGESFDVRLGDRGDARVCLTAGIGGSPTS